MHPGKRATRRMPVHSALEKRLTQRSAARTHPWKPRPLFGLIKGTGSNRKIEYVYDEAALKRTLTQRIEERKAAGMKVDESAERFKQAGFTAQQRFKGLGEMDAAQLWETTMNPANRTLVRVNVEDAEKADAIFTKLMGEGVELRKNFIQTNASKVNLDDLDF